MDNEKTKVMKPIKKQTKRKINASFIISVIGCSVAFILSLIFIGYTILGCNNQINKLFLIINSLIIFIFISTISIGILIQKHKIKNIFMSISTAFISLFILFNILSLSNIIKIPTQAVLESFINKNVSEIINFGNKNKITINQTYEYSDTIKENFIISQDKLPNTILKKIKEINIVVSNGPNYDKKFILQNLVGLNIDEVLKITNDNFMNNISVEYQINNEIPKDIVISQNINGEIKRNDLLSLVVSLGTKDEIIPVKMINLKNKSLFEATLWLKRNGIDYELTYEFSDKINKNYCISQSEKEETTIDPNKTKITLIISKGKEIKIPDFTSMSVEEATNWITENKLKLTFKNAYDNEIEVGNIISCNFAINSKVEEGTAIELTISKGKLKMEQFDNISDFRSWASGLGLEYEENSEFSDKEIGKIISIKPDIGSTINLSEKIQITYSKGKSTNVPDFYNKTKNEANSLCTKNNLKCIYSYKYSNSIAEGNVVSQSMSKGSVVAENTSITIYLSKGKEPVVQTCDKSITDTVYLTSGNDGEQTKTLTKKMNPNIKWNFNMVDKCSNGSTASGTICNAPDYDNKKLNRCDTYTLTIVK